MRRFIGLLIGAAFAGLPAPLAAEPLRASSCRPGSTAAVAPAEVAPGRGPAGRVVAPADVPRPATDPNIAVEITTNLAPYGVGRIGPAPIGTQSRLGYVEIVEGQTLLNGRRLVVPAEPDCR